MREYSAPSDFDTAVDGSLTDDVVSNAAEHPTAVAFTRRKGPEPVPVTTADFHHEVRQVAKGLIASGLEPGERIAILSRTRYEWTLFDYAMWYAGAVSVPVYDTASTAQLEWILSDSGASAILVESAGHGASVEQVQHRLPRLGRVWSLDDEALGELEELGARVSDTELNQRRAAVTPDSIATIMYTSGTSGRPKGCVLTHENLMFEIAAAVEALDELFSEKDAATLLLLPLPHAFARVVQLGAIHSRTRIGYSSDVKALADDLVSFQPTFILGVPRVFEKLFNAASQNARIAGRGQLFDRAVNTAIAYSRALDQGRPPAGLRARRAIFDRISYGKFRADLGGSCRYAISGGAPLGERLGHFYRGIGVKVLEGYGLTETSAAATVNRPALNRIGSVGQPLPGTTVRVVDDGELVVRGRQIMQGYWQDPEATAEVMTKNRWLRTGDLGEIDDEGFVWISGRKKEILVTAGGKHVAPAPIEERIREHSLISQCLLVGDGKPFISALITLDPDIAKSWAQARGKSDKPADLAKDRELRSEIQTAVDAANEHVSQAEAVRQFAVLTGDWSERSGELTPSLKVRRSAVLAAFRHQIDGLYDD